MHELYDYIRHELTSKLQDPAFRAGLAKTPADRREHPELHLCDLYDQIGSYVRAGLIDEELFLRPHFHAIIMNWDLLQPVIMIVRRDRPAALMNFEYLTVRAHAWLDRYPTGFYPEGMPHMPDVDVWLEADTPKPPANNA